MHSATNLITPSQYTNRTGFRVLAITAVCASFAGCSSRRPFRSLVQVTEDPAAIVAEVEAPEQRLATSATRKQSPSMESADSAKKPGLANAVAGVPDVFREKPRKQTAVVNDTPRMSLSDASASSESGQRKVNASLAKAKTSKATKPQTAVLAAAKADLNSLSASQQKPATVKTGEVLNPKPSAVTDDDVEVTSSGLVSASLTDLSNPAEPEASAQAQVASSEPNLQQVGPETPAAKPEATEPVANSLVVSSSNKRPSVRRRPNSQTDQPNALTRALEQSLAELPTLPNVKPKSSGLMPTRIGTGQPMLARNHSGSASQPREQKNAELVAERVTNQSTPVIKTKPDNSVAQLAVETTLPVVTPVVTVPPEAESPSIVLNANQVRPVSHASGDAKYAVARGVNEQLPTRQLSEAELYGQLLSRITEPSPGETPIERERRQIVAKHLMVLAGEPESAIESIEGLNETEQHYLKNQLMGLWTMIDPDGHPSSGRRITEALPRFREATRYMAAATDSLALNSLEFCTEIESYGQIKPFEGNRFAAGQQVILYCEVENFAAENKNGHYQTQLQGNYDIYDATGTKVISQLLPADQQRSRNQLRDYFVAYQMNLPKGLPSGTYRLQLTIEDVVGKKYGQSNIPFEIR